METVAKNYPVFEDVELSKLPILPTINIRAILGGECIPLIFLNL